MASSLALGFILDCAKAIEDGDLESADGFLHRILNVADKEPRKCRKKVVEYFAEALVRRAYGLPPPSSYYTLVMDRRAFSYYGSYYIKDIIGNAIKNALPLMGQKRFHLVDFSSPVSSSVLNMLPNSYYDPLSVRLSLILSPILENFINTKHLTEEAKRLNIKMEDELKVVYATSLGEVDESKLDFNRGDEATVVFYNLKLNKLLKDSKAMETELVRLREINPAVVFMLESYVNRNEFNFLTYLEDSFQYYSDLIEDVFWDFLDESHWRHNVETHEGQDLIRRHKTLPEWQKIFLMGGFRQVLLAPSEDSRVGRSPRSRETMREENGCLVFGCKQRPTFFLSAWKPEVEDEHLNCNLSSHKLGPGFNSNSPLDTTIPSLHPLQPLMEGLALNQLAAFAEIHDILKDLCHKYDIPLALAWDSRVNDMNGNMSHPYKNRTLFIRSNSCYMKNWSSYDLWMDYANAIHFLQKGSPFVAGKALESSDGYYFESSVRNICARDVEYLLETNNHGVVASFAICLRNCYTSNEVYVVEFCWESEKSDYLLLGIFDELKSMKKKFVTVNVQDTEIGIQEKAVSNILPPSSSTSTFLNSSTTKSSKTVDEARDVHASDQREAVPNFQSPTLVHSSSQVAVAPFNTPEGSYYQNKRKRKMDEDSNVAKVPRSWSKNDPDMNQCWLDDESLFNSDQSDEFQSSSSESEE